LPPPALPSIALVTAHAPSFSAGAPDSAAYELLFVTQGLRRRRTRSAIIHTREEIQKTSQPHTQTENNCSPEIGSHQTLSHIPTLCEPPIACCVAAAVKNPQTLQSAPVPYRRHACSARDLLSKLLSHERLARPVCLSARTEVKAHLHSSGRLSMSFAQPKLKTHLPCNTESMKFVLYQRELRSRHTFTALLSQFPWKIRSRLLRQELPFEPGTRVRSASWLLPLLLQKDGQY
jgi:hypothetical protein